MTNFEKYGMKILCESTGSDCLMYDLRTNTYRHPDRECPDKYSCEQCHEDNVEWLKQDYLSINWDNVKQGTDIYLENEYIGKFIAIYDDTVVLDTNDIDDDTYAGYNKNNKLLNIKNY